MFTELESRINEHLQDGWLFFDKVCYDNNISMHVVVIFQKPIEDHEDDLDDFFPG